MKPKTDEPLRGDAAWRVTKHRIAKRNDAARACGGAEREAHDAKQAERRLEAARLARARLPKRSSPYAGTQPACRGSGDAATSL